MFRGRLPEPPSPPLPFHLHTARELPSPPNSSYEREKPRGRCKGSWLRAMIGLFQKSRVTSAAHTGTADKGTPSQPKHTDSLYPQGFMNNDDRDKSRGEKEIEKKNKNPLDILKVSR